MKRLMKKHILNIITIAAIWLLFPFFDVEAYWEGVSYYVSGYADSTQITFLNGQDHYININRGDGSNIRPYNDTTNTECQRTLTYITCTHNYLSSGVIAPEEYLIEIIADNGWEDSLKYLDLSNANITKLGHFWWAPALQNINLSHNEITSRNYDAFSWLTELSTLDLSYNNITNITGSLKIEPHLNPFYNTLMSNWTEQPWTINLNNNPIQDIAAFLPESITSGQGYWFSKIFPYTYLKLADEYTVKWNGSNNNEQTIEVNNGIYVSHEVVKENSGYTWYAYNHNFPNGIWAEYKIYITETNTTLTWEVSPTYNQENWYYTSLPKFHITESQICQNLRSKNIINSENTNLNIKFDEINILPEDPINITVSYPNGYHEKTYPLTCPAVSNLYSLTIHYLYYGSPNKATWDYVDLNLSGWSYYYIQSPSISGYTADPLIVNWTITWDTVVTVRYTQNSNNQGNGWQNGSGTDNPNNPWNGWGNGWGNQSNQTYPLTILCIYTRNQLVMPPIDLEITGWATYIARIPTPEYYTPICSDCTIDNTTTWVVVTWIMPYHSGSIYVYYKPDKDDNTNGIADEEETYTLTINHVYNNWSWIDSGSKQVLSWATYTGKILNILGYTPTITGYSIDPDSLIYWFMPWHDHTITITYSPNNLLNSSLSHTLKVDYILTGKSLTPFIWQLSEWQEYSVTPSPITYYHPNPSIVKWTMTWTDITETVYYEPNNDDNTNGIADEEETHYLNISYIYSNWTFAKPSNSYPFLEWDTYSVTSPNDIPNYTPNPLTVTWKMWKKDKDVTVTYSLTKDDNHNWISDNLETYTLIISYYKDGWSDPFQIYSWKYLQWEIYSVKSPSIANYTPEVSIVYWTMPKNHEFLRVNYKKVETTTSEWWSSWWSSWWGSSSSSTKSDLSISSYNEDVTVDDWVWITISTNSSYRWKISFNKLQYQSTNWNWIDVSTTSKTYIKEASEEFDLWYKMTASDSGKKTIKNLIKFKIGWKYRLYAEDKNWYSDYIQFYVDDENSWSENSKENDKNNNSWTENTLLNWSNQHWSYSGEVYTTRNCKQYNIQYDNNLDVYTSPNLKKAEYFVSPDYLKRYIDSKNTRQSWCPANTWRTSTSYLDKSNSTDKYIAPNGKTYFILWWNGNYYSNQLSSNKWFSTLNEIKYYIRDHNPLIWTK